MKVIWNYTIYNRYPMDCILRLSVKQLSKCKICRRHPSLLPAAGGNKVSGRWEWSAEDRALLRELAKSGAGCQHRTE